MNEWSRIPLPLISWKLACGASAFEAFSFWAGIFVDIQAWKNLSQLERHSSCGSDHCLSVLFVIAHRCWSSTPIRMHKCLLRWSSLGFRTELAWPQS
eukprot:symbB.v1.2.038097.t1/scaffold5803.1/size23515/2